MDHPYIERRSLHAAAPSKDVAQHLYTRQIPGVAIIVNDRPEIFLASVRKQWFAILRTIQKERASTLTSAKILELNRQSMYMQRLRMAAIKPDPDFVSGVFFVTQDDLQDIPLATHTIYLTNGLGKLSLSEMYTELNQDTLIVLY